LTIVSASAIGHDLESVARAASEALGQPVAVTGQPGDQPVVWPPGAVELEDLRALAGVAGAAVKALLRERDQALRETELLAELIADGTLANGFGDTYRLLIGVLLRDRDELEQLRAQTISPLVQYDAEHDSELLRTLRAFLAHDGSTSETAEAMGLHRHTVGYRLARVQEVCGLSPHESDGRERLGLGLKADQILEAEDRLHEPE
jgi:DNA-binding PucR family transcriptional regulator